MPGMSFHDYVLQHDQTQKDGAFFVYTARVHLPTLAHSLRNKYMTDTPSESYIGRASELTCPKEQADEWEPWWDMGWFKEFLGSRCGVSADQMGETFADYWDEHLKVPRPESDIVFFTQGARFAASKARIQQRPKAEYEQMLQLLSWDRDPCVNYLNEWSWSYLIGKPETTPCNIAEAERVPAHVGARLLSPMVAVSGSISGISAPCVSTCNTVTTADVALGGTYLPLADTDGCCPGDMLMVKDYYYSLVSVTATRRLLEGRRLGAGNANINPAAQQNIPAGAGVQAHPFTTTTTDLSFGLPWWFWMLLYCLCCLCLSLCGVIPLPFLTGKKKPTKAPTAAPSVVEEVVTVEDEEPLVPMATAMVPTASMAVPATAGYGMATSGYGAGYGVAQPGYGAGYAAPGYGSGYPAAY